MNQETCLNAALRDVRRTVLPNGLTIISEEMPIIVLSRRCVGPDGLTPRAA